MCNISIILEKTVVRPNAKMHSLGFNGGGEMKELEAPW